MTAQSKLLVSRDWLNDGKVPTAATWLTESLSLRCEGWNDAMAVAS